MATEQGGDEMQPEVLLSEQEMFEIRPATLNDRGAMVDVYGSVYGSLYPYMPTNESLCPESGYFVVLTRNGHVIGGCGGFERRSQGYDWLEWARLAVHRNHWSKGHGKRLNKGRLALLRGRSVHSPVVSETVCNNTRNQRILATYGFKAMGIQPAIYPAVVLEKLGRQPETLLINVRWSAGNEHGDFGARRLYVPEHWLDGLRHLVPEYRLEQALRAHNGIIHGARTRHHGPYTSEQLGVTGSSFVDIPLNHPSALFESANYEKEGYRLCGFLPSIHDPEVGAVDRARLYKPNCEIDWDLVQVEPATAPFRRWLINNARA